MNRTFSVKLIFFFAFLIVMHPTGAVCARILTADANASSGSPNYYGTLVAQLRPGDTLVLPAGTYRERLNLSNLQGTSDAWITIAGPESGPPAVITTNSTCCNTVQLGNTSFVAIRNLTIDSNSVALGESLDGINAKDGPTHDILIENCSLTGLSYHQSTVGISTKSPAWNWRIRKNKILQAGTGIYLGNSDGTQPFVAGIIEGNLIVDTIGYNIEIKYQKPYTLLSGMPAASNKTVIRNNVFIKRIAQSEWAPMSDGNSRVSGARPSVLVGGFPDSGPGANDLYEIYANFFYRNPDESLLQASGRVAIHDNIFVGASGTAVRVQNHDLPLKLAFIYNNTIYGGTTGISCGTAPAQGGAAVGNLVFSSAAVSGPLMPQEGNLLYPAAAAAGYVRKPSLVLGDMDFYPLPGQCQGAALDLSRFASNTDYDLDFNGNSKRTLSFRGAYAGDGVNTGWELNEGLKAGGPSSSGNAGSLVYPPTNLHFP
jgi:hypothetical protein